MKVSEATVVAVWRCAACHCSTEVPMPKPSGCCPACQRFMWEDVLQPRYDSVNAAIIAALKRKEVGRECLAPSVYVAAQSTTRLNHSERR